LLIIGITRGITRVYTGDPCYYQGLGTRGITTVLQVSIRDLYTVYTRYYICIYHVKPRGYWLCLASHPTDFCICKMRRV